MIDETGALQEASNTVPGLGDVGAWWEENAFQPAVKGVAQTTIQAVPWLGLGSFIARETIGSGTEKAY